MKKVNSTVRLDIDRVRQKIAIHGYKYSALADSVGVSTNAIKNWLSGRTRAIYSKNAVLLAKAFQCRVDDIVLREASPRKAGEADLIATIFDHRIKVFGLLKIKAVGIASDDHLGEIHAVFSTLLKSLNATVQEFGSCQVFAFIPTEPLSPSKQIQAAIERLATFEEAAGQIEAKFSGCSTTYSMIISLSSGNRLDHGISREDTYSYNLGKLLRYVDDLAGLPPGNGIYCSHHFHELAASLPEIAFEQDSESAANVTSHPSLIKVQLTPRGGWSRPHDPSAIQVRQKLLSASAENRDRRHLHIFGGEGTGKSIALAMIADAEDNFCSGYRKVGPICGNRGYAEERPAALGLVVGYIEGLVKAGHDLPAIKTFIRTKCGDISPAIDSILLSQLGYETFHQRSRFYDQAAIDKLCFRAIIRLLQLDSRVYRSVLLVDDYDGLDGFSRAFVDFVRLRFECCPHLKLLTTGRKPLEDAGDISTSIRLDNFSLAETLSFFSPVAEGTPAESIETIHELTKGHPMLLAEVRQRWFAYCLPEPSLNAAFKAKKPHQNLYYLLTKGLDPLQIEALQVLAVADGVVIDSGIISHLEWSLSGQQKLSTVLDTIVEEQDIISSDRNGYRFRHRLYLVAFNLSVSGKIRHKIHLVLHSYWEGFLVSRQAEGEDSSKVLKQLLRHSLGCRRYGEYGQYACQHFSSILKQGKLDGLLDQVNGAIKRLLRVTPARDIHSALCQLYLIKTKIAFLTKGWTHPDILKYVLRSEGHDHHGQYQPLLAFLKIYFYWEKADLAKVHEIYGQIDTKALQRDCPVIYVALLCIYSGAKFMSGHLAQGLKLLEKAQQQYDDLGSGEPFIELLDLEYGVWVYGSLALTSFMTGNPTKIDPLLAEGQRISENQEHLATSGCFLLFESMVGMLRGEHAKVRERTKPYLHRTAPLPSAQATIWPFYYWAVGNADKLFEHIAGLKAAENFLLCSFFYLMAADVKWRKGEKLAAKKALQQARELELTLGQSFVTPLLHNKSTGMSAALLES